MGLKDLLNKGMCLVGLHQGEWRAGSPNCCTFTRTCERCGAEHQKVEHPWGEWGFVADGACDQVRSCGRCRSQEQRVSHAWAEPFSRLSAAASGTRCASAVEGSSPRRWRT